MKQALRLFAILTITALSFENASAQFPSAFTASANGSDYNVEFTWAAVSGDRGCNCWEVNYNRYVRLTVGTSLTCNSSVYTNTQIYGGGTGAGSFTYAVGPNVTRLYGVIHQVTQNGAFCSCNNQIASCAARSTANTKTPSNIQAQDAVSYTDIEVTWDRSTTTDIPEADLRYRVYKDGALAYTTTAASVFSWTDTGMNPGESHSYSVSAVYSPTTTASSLSGANTGSTISIALTSSDLAYANRTKLEWPNLSSFADEIRVYRGTEEIAIISGNATSYSDYDGVPGVAYIYKIEPISPSGSAYPLYSDSGTRKPNGRISGEVTTPFLAGVSGVTVTATAMVGGTPYSYVATTDASGYYSIPEIFYNEEAEYQISPSKPEHGFNPGSSTRTLDLLSPVISGLNFTDTTVFSILGKAHFPVLTAGDTCWIMGADILLDGNPTGITTDFQGRYSLGVQELGIHTIGIVYEDHVFNPASYSINVNDNYFNQDFINTTTDSVVVTVKGGCDNIISDYATFTVRSTDPGSCYNETHTTGASGVSTLVLPAREYEIEVTGVFVNGNNDQNILSYYDPIVVDLTVRDSVFSADSTYMIPVVATAPFIYHSNIEIIVNNLDAPVCGPGGSLLNLMVQGEQQQVEIVVMETHSYPTLQSCPVDTGTVTFVDEISEIPPVTLELVNGVTYHNIFPGTPNVLGGGAHPYQKLLQVIADVGFSNPVTEEIWALVEGNRPREQTFVTKTPELPFFVLHDPPGDASYSYMEEDSSYTYAYSNSYQYGGGAGPFLDLKIGVGIPIPFTGIEIGAGTHIEASAVAGRDNADNNALITTFSTTELFSTSSSDAIIGAPGDVFVGGSFNMIYALTDVIEYDAGSCSIIADTTLAWGANDLATTYIYTEQHIRGTLLPQLHLLQSFTTGDSVDLFQGYIDVWDQVLANNEANKLAADQIENISFSAGASYESSTTTATDTSYGIEYDIYLEVDLSIAAVVGAGDFNETEFGVKSKFKWNTGYADNTNIVQSKTIGYHLEDDDAGDFFSIDVKKDKVYGTPVFTLAAGTTSCPYEPGSQPRDEPSITLDSYIASNVPANDQAVFVANLGNLSQSGETREYAIRSLNQSNLDGAIIKLGGQLISGGAINYTIPAGQQIPALLTVERGPLASTYEDLQVFMYVPCEAVGSASSSWNIRQSDTITFSAFFQSECSDVELYQPDNNWVANASNNDNIYIVYTGYNMNDPNLVDIRFQYRRSGQGWETAGIVPGAQLTQQYYNYNFDISGIPDGNYEFRALANCGAQIGTNYSPVKSGIIDRSSISLFGVPTPADGVLNVDEAISVTFNEPIDCDLIYDPVQITLVRTDTGADIPITFSCNGNTILIETNPTSLLNSLENINLTATVSNLSDFNGNELGDPVVWSFGVNRGQVYWDPSNVVATSVVNQTANFSSELRNVSASAQNYTLTQIPAWLTTTQTSGSVPNGGVIPIDFEISASLDLGIYEDTVKVTINGQEQYLFVYLEVNSLAPDWTVNPADFQYSLSMTGQFSISDLDAPLSTDTRDIIAAFVDGECRGVANIAYVPNLNVYSAFMTVYSNMPFGEDLGFRFWDAYPGTEYQAEETLAFIADQSVGQALSPYILHPGGVFQTINFSPGWNWFSLNVLADDMTVDSVLSTVIANNGDVVKTQNGGSQYSDTTGWWGTLTELDNDHSYQILVSEASSLRFLGEPLPDDYEVQVAAGWNWLGYPRLGINPVGEMLESYAATQSDLIKSDLEFANYDSGSGDWIGSMAALKPGRGYKLKTVNPGGIQFIGGAPPTPPLEDCEQFQLFENNMTVTAKLTNNGIDVFDSHFIVSASINDSCRAWAQPEFIPELNAYRMLLTLPGYLTNTGAAISFEVEDLDNGNIYIPEYTPVSFNSNDVVGDLESAFVLNLNTVGIEETLNLQGHWLGQNVPNPFNDQTLIPYSIGKSTNVQLEVYDMIGNRVMQLVSQSQAAGTYQVSFNRDVLAGGMYMYVLSTDQGRQTKRMILTD